MTVKTLVQELREAEVGETTAVLMMRAADELEKLQRRDRDAVAGLSDAQQAVIANAAFVLKGAALGFASPGSKADRVHRSRVCEKHADALLKLLAEGKVK